MRKCIINYLILTFCLFLTAANFNLFMKPINFVTGGTPGLAIIVENFFHIPINYFIYFVYILMFSISFIILGKKSIVAILYATIFYPLFITLTSNIIKYIIIDYNDFFLVAIFAGIISGIGNGIIYRLGFPSSGLGVMGPICNKLFHFSISNTNFAINVIIVLLGGYLFGINMILYAIIFLYINSYISNKIILGVSFNKVVLIHSKKIDKINQMIYNDFLIEPIVFDSMGNYKKNNNCITVFAISTFKYNRVIEQIRKIDNEVFYNVLDGYELKELYDRT